MKKKYKGFTLIELLAVVIVLAVIAVVAVPIVLDVVEDARNKANEETVYGIINGGKYYYTESMLDSEKESKLDGKTNIYDEIVLNGEKPKEGYLYVNEQGQVSTLVKIEDKCYKKTFYGELEQLSSDDEECDVGKIVNDLEKPNISFKINGELGTNNWYKSKVYVEIQASDKESGILKYEWCSSAEESCELNNTETISKNIEVLNGYKVCAKAYDKSGNESDIECSDIINIDTVAPEFSGIADITVSKNEEVDLTKDVIITDTLSGVESETSYIYTPETVDTSKTGVTEVIYTAYDKAGNKQEITRKVIVSSEAPTISFNVEEDTLNEYGWSNKDFYVTINVVDNSGHGVKEFKVCTATTDTCDIEKGSIITGKLSETRQIVQESSNNRICVQAVDNYNQKSPVVCSDAYKLDKTKPEAGTINIDGTQGLEGWYTTDVTISSVDGTDSLSGHLETTVDTLSITENTSSQIVTVTTKDKAGNTSTRTYTLKLDKTKPNVEFTIKAIDGNNGWYKSEVTLKAIVTDTNYSKLRWCQGLSCTPTTEITSNEKSITLQNTKGTELCIIGIDKAGNESGKVCSDVIKVDTVLPEFNGIADITVTKDAAVDLRNGVTVKDDTSDIDGGFTIVTEFGNETIDTSKTGEYKAIYTVYDKAGNKKEITRKVIVSADAPKITFTAEDVINEYGWSNKDFYVTINVFDNSGHGIKEFKVCTATTDTCDVEKGSTITNKLTESRQIVQESSNNRICVQAVDKADKKSSVVCSDAYKLDKTKPTVGSIDITGTLKENGWYTSDVTIIPIDGSDTLSGHLETTIDKTTITTNTKGENVKVTTKDKAYNEITKDYEIKIDKAKPICSISTLNYIGVGKTATVELTCTNDISGIKETVLQPGDFTVSNAKVTQVNKMSVTNGYRYTITLEGTSVGTFNVTLPAGKIKTNAGLSNTAISSNTITVTSLSINPASGTLYVGGSNVTATVTSNNAGTLSCVSNNTSIATCSISGTTLTVSPKAEGSATITVTGNNGFATATYTATVKTVTLSINPTSGTLYVGGNSKTATISGDNYKDLSCTSSNTSIATCTVSGTTLTISPKSSGNVTITVSEKNANKQVTYTANVLQPTLTLSETSGTLYVNGSNKVVSIAGENYGTLSCRSNDDTIATCTVSQTGLTVIPKGVGKATITVEESNGKVTKTYTATVVQPTLTLSETSGVIYNGGSSKTVTIGGTNYGTLSCESKDISIATCTISGTTLTITPGATAGTTTITVTESNGKVSTTYSVTNKIPTITLSSTSGTTYIGGSNLTATITTTDAGSLTCSSNDNLIATCTISGNTLTMTPGTKAGSAVITAKESNGNKTAKYTFNNLSTDFEFDITFTPRDANFYKDDAIRYWLNKDYYVDVVATSEETIVKMEMCTATTNTCDPTGKATMNGSSGSMLIAQESNNNRVCVRVYDSIGRKGLECSEAFGLDKTKPTAGTIKVNGSNPSEDWYNTALTITKVDGSDALSGHLNTTVDTTSVASSTSSKTVKVTTTDKAGNSSTRTYTLKTDLTVPEVTIAKSSGSTKLTATVTPSTTISDYIYQWYKNGNAINGETSTTYTPNSAGVYTIKVTTGAGKVVTSNEITISGYTVTYDLNGGVGNIANQTKVQDISLTLSLSIPTKDGYTFQGWGSSANDTSVDYASGASYTGNKSITLYAIWKKTVTITFNGNGATIDKTSATCDMYNADTGCIVTFPTITRSGFTITGFNTSSSATTATVESGKEASVSSNATYYAITSKEIAVTFYRNGAASITPSGGSASTATSLTQKCTIRNSATNCSITSPTITASSNTPTVLGWNISSSSTSSSWSQSTSKTFTANASYYAITKKDAVTYNITYAKGNGVSAIGATSGSCSIAATYNGAQQSTNCSITFPTITASTGYTASGWYNSSNTKLGNASATVSVSSSQILTAKSTVNSYTVTYDYATNGGSGATTTSASVKYTDLISLTPTATKSGYEFVGWNTNKDATEGLSSLTMGTSNVTLYAIYRKQITITLNGNGATVSASSVSCDLYNKQTSCEVTFPTIERTGYTVTGVNTNKDATTATVTSGAKTSVSASATYYAITNKVINANFVANGATLVDTANTDSNTKDSCTLWNTATNCTVHSPNITRSGYIIVGFNTSASATTSTWNVNTSKSISDDVTYYAITKEVVLGLTSTSGTTYVGGSNLTTTISSTSKNYGELSCSSSNPSVATCSISGTTITMVPGNTSGSSVITVTEKNVGKTAKYTFNNKPTDIEFDVTFTAPDAKYYEDDNVRYWLNEEYYVNVAVTSQETITKIEMCTATTNTCDPTGKATVNGTSGSMLIAVESNNNRVCVQVHDSIGRKGIECSEAFGLDKTKPIVTYNYEEKGQINWHGYGEVDMGCFKEPISPIMQPVDTGGSGIYVANVSVWKDGEWINNQVALGNNRYQIPMTEHGMYIPHVELVDGAGNFNETTRVVPNAPDQFHLSVWQIDTSAPTLSVNFNGYTPGTSTNSNITVTLTGANTGCDGEVNFYYSINDGEWQFLATGVTGDSVNYTINEDANYNIKFAVKDNFGRFGTITENYSIVRSSSICRRATTLHTQTCNKDANNGHLYCTGDGYAEGDTISYGTLGNLGTLKSGDAFDCDVNGDGTYNAINERFYYVSDYYDTSTKTFNSDYAVLIYYNNIATSVHYNGSEYPTNRKGPLTAMEKLPTNSQWSKVSLFKENRNLLDEKGTRYKTTNNDYDISYTGYAARFLTIQEINQACGVNIVAGYTKNGLLKDCQYLLENARYNISNGQYYWLETIYSADQAGYYPSTGWVVEGMWRGGSGYNVTSGVFGVRPVIEVPKTDISY